MFVCVFVCVGGRGGGEGGAGGGECVLFVYSIFISIIHVSQVEVNLITSNQQIYDLYK